ncbi:MAG: DUF4405 domain-containing protein [Planctomycetota bacterium]
MRKNTVNFLVDLATLLAILAMTGTGLILKYSLPPGSGGRGLVLWGLGRHDWGGIHFWIAVGLGLLLVVHLVLHWPWVVATFRRLTSGTGARVAPPWLSTSRGWPFCSRPRALPPGSRSSRTPACPHPVRRRGSMPASTPRWDSMPPAQAVPRGVNRLQRIVIMVRCRSAAP